MTARPIDRIVLWLDSPSIHQAPLVTALARTWDGELVVATERDMSERRLRSGWKRADFTPARLLIAPSRPERLRILEEGDRARTVHVFSGLHAYPDTYWTLGRAARAGARVGIYAEKPADDGSAKSVARRLVYRLQALRWGRRLEFVLATGSAAARWYAGVGFRAERIFPFAYFTEPRDAVAEAAPEATDEVRLLFVGQLIPRKGVDLLLRALAPLRGAPWRLAIAGGGPEEEAYRSLADTLGIGGRVEWLGQLANDAAQRLMGRADTLVLPSRHDGWGAVVNEALTAGTPVVVSDACGASDLAARPGAGRVVAAGSVESLSAALGETVAAGPVDARRRDGLRRWAGQAIRPEAGAAYLLQVLSHAGGGAPRPTPPWW